MEGAVINVVEVAEVGHRIQPVDAVHRDPADDRDIDAGRANLLDDRRAAHAGGTGEGDEVGVRLLEAGDLARRRGVGLAVEGVVAGHGAEPVLPARLEVVGELPTCVSFKMKGILQPWACAHSAMIAPSAGVPMPMEKARSPIP